MVEDEAYCLLGLFGIHLSPIYGEGKKALIRLQQELLRTYNDESVLAWNGEQCLSPLGSRDAFCALTPCSICV